jgi:hypothetical protein
MTTRRMTILALPIVLFAWIAMLALVMRFGGGAPAALVFFPPDGFATRLPPGTAIIASGPASLTVSGGSDLVPALYSAGAWLVLPAGLTSCLQRSWEAQT